MFRKAKLIKLPQPLIDFCKKEFLAHFGHILKHNLPDTNNLDAQDLDYLAKNEKVFREFYNVFPSTPNKREIWENYVDAADSIKNYEPDILSFKDYEFYTSQGNKYFMFLKKHTMEILEQQKKMISNFRILYQYPDIEDAISLPKPFVASSKKCESKPFILTPQHLKGMPYITALPKQYTFIVETVLYSNSDSDGSCTFYPNQNKFVVTYKITKDMLEKQPIYYIANLDEVTEHELTHFVQYLMKDITSVSSWGDVGQTRGPNTAWQDLPIEYKAIFRDQFVRLTKMKQHLDLSSYRSFIKSIEDHIQYLPKIEDIKKDSPEKFTPFMTQLFVLLRK